MGSKVLESTPCLLTRLSPIMQMKSRDSKCVQGLNEIIYYSPSFAQGRRGACGSKWVGIHPLPIGPVETINQGIKGGKGFSLEYDTIETFMWY